MEGYLPITRGLRLAHFVGPLRRPGSGSLQHQMELKAEASHIQDVAWRGLVVAEERNGRRT
jgi:hypothetical protein